MQMQSKWIAKAMTNVITLDRAKGMYAPLGYDIIDEISTKGGFKQVFLAMYKGNKVAFKVLHMPLWTMETVGIQTHHVIRRAICHTIKP